MNPAEERVRSVLLRYERRGELHPGASDTLSQIWGNSYGALGDAGKRWRSSEFVEPPAPSGGPASALRIAVRRMAPELRDGVEDALVGALAARLSHLEGPGLAGALAGELGKRDFAEKYARVLPEVPASERRVGDVLRRHFPDIDSAARDRFTRERGQDLDRLDETNLVRTAARAFQIGAVADRYGAAPLPPDDARTTYTPAGAPTAPPPTTTRL
jgi:hypothetical protein